MFDFEKISSSDFDFESFNKISPLESLKIKGEMVKVAMQFAEFRILDEYYHSNKNMTRFSTLEDIDIDVSAKKKVGINITAHKFFISNYSSRAFSDISKVVNKIYLTDSEQETFYNSLIFVDGALETFSACYFWIINSANHAYGSTSNGITQIKNALARLSETAVLLSQSKFDGFKIYDGRYFLSSKTFEMFERTLSNKELSVKFCKAANPAVMLNSLNWKADNMFSLSNNDDLMAAFFDCIRKDKNLTAKMSYISRMVLKNFLSVHGTSKASLDKFNTITKINVFDVSKSKQLEIYASIGYKNCIDEMLESKNADVRYVAAQFLPYGDKRLEKLMNDRSKKVFYRVLEKIDVNQIVLMLGSNKLQDKKAKEILNGRLK